MPVLDGERAIPCAHPDGVPGGGDDDGGRPVGAAAEKSLEVGLDTRSRPGFAGRDAHDPFYQGIFVISCITKSAPSSTLTRPTSPFNSLWNPRVSPISSRASSSG